MSLADDLYIAIRVAAVATSNITIATALNPGDTLNGRTLVAGDLVGVVAQTNAYENGVYRVGTVPTRDSNFNSLAGGGKKGPEGAYDMHPGLILVEEQTGLIYQCTSVRGGTLGTTNLAFTRLYASAEDIQDIVGAMFSGNTETGGSFTYQDSDGTIDFALDDEYVQDLVGGMFTGNTVTSGITFTYNDTTGKVDVTISASNLKTTLGYPTSTTTNALAKFTNTSGSIGNSVALIDSNNVLDGIAYRTVNYTIADDAVQAIQLPANTTGYATVNSSSVAGSALVAFRAGSTPTVTAVHAGSLVNTTTGVLTGTTGTDGKVTISTHTDSIFYIENRVGAAVAFGSWFTQR